MQRILCVCLGNRSRSPMMQALLQLELGDASLVESAGVRREAAGLPADPRAVQCMRDRGIDLSNHQSRWAGDLALADYARIFCVDGEIARRVRALAPEDAKVVVSVVNGRGDGIPDPFEGGLPAYRSCLVLLDHIIPALAAQSART